MSKLKHALQYKAVGLVHTPYGLIDYASGWWYDEAKARAELDQVLERNLPAGIYNIATIVKERVYAL